MATFLNIRTTYKKMQMILSISTIFTIAVPMEEIIRNIVMVLGMFLLVYGIYFIATDVQFTRNIDGID